MNRNLVIVLAGGFLIAVLVAVMVQASLGRKKEVAVTEEPRTKIVVAAKALPVGAQLTAENIRWQEWPQNAVFPGAITPQPDKKITDLAKGKVRRALAEGEPVIESVLVKEGEGNFVAASLKEGMRAVAISTSASQMAGGFIGPGDYVDVMLSYKKTVVYEGDNPNVEDMIRLNFDRYATETILQNVRVVAIDQSSKRDPEKSVKVGKTVTLEVDRKGAEILALADNVGEISLALRKLGDDKQYDRDYKVMTDARITTISDELYREMRQIENTSGQNGNVVRIYNGFSTSQTSAGR